MNKLILTFAIISMIGVSCSKTTTTTTTTTTTPTNPQPTFGSTVDGGMVAVNTVTTTTTMGTTYDVPLGTGVAVFGNLGAGTYSDAGAITLNAKALTIQTNKSYIFAPSMTDPTGIDFSSSIKWTVAGNSASGITGFNHTTSKNMPEAGKISGTFTEINTASDFNLSTTSVITKADSVYFQIAGGSKVLLKVKPASINTVTFTSAELKTLGTGTGSIVIAPWNYETKVYNGKTYAFVNELALSKVITLK